jgi:cysteinyl-tRNA synthetase
MQPPAEPIGKAFCEAMDDDFNTAKGVGILFNLVKEANRIVDEGASRKHTAEPLAILAADLVKMSRILGILNQPWQTFFEQRSNNRLQHMVFTAEAIDALVAERTAARNEKDWKRADEIRNQLEKEGIILEDKTDGTRWKVVT